MKSLKCLVLALLISGAAFAGGSDDKEKSQVQDKEMVSHGFYINLGLGFPSIGGNGLGIQPTIELGNQWMIVNNDDVWGIGLNVSWITLGFSHNSEYRNVSENPLTTVWFQPLKVGPMFNYAITDNMAIDAYFNVAPTVRASIGENDSEISAGVAFAPGARFRINKFMVGFENQFGSFDTAGIDNTSGAGTLDGSQAYFNPRLLVGFKF